jgi:hypothetical protein
VSLHLTLQFILSRGRDQLFAFARLKLKDALSSTTP